MLRRHFICVLAVVFMGVRAGAAGAASGARVPWTTSRVMGSPEPPPAFRLERAFGSLKFDNPVDMVLGPASTKRLFVVEQYGKIFSFPADGSGDKQLAIDLKKDLPGLDQVPTCRGVSNVYAIVFHPDFEKNHFAYVCYILDVPVPGPSAEIGSRISRFTVRTENGVPRFDPASEVVLLSWRAGGHNGCCLKFSREGYLYISTGDSADPNPPDKFDTGQSVNDLLSSILRIDVNREEGGRHYAIPVDNPFVKTPGARPEVYAYGLRNPWRMGIDRATGDLWVADVGWELWESIHRIAPGGNYGWSIMEGPQPVRSDVKQGPTPIVPPLLALPHSDSCSITGGTVYRGKQYPELAGQYVFGDWETRRVWASKVTAENKLEPYRLIAEGDVRVVNFTEDAGSELYVLGYDDGGIHRIVRNDASAAAKGFPRKLTETGLFASVKERTPAAGVVPFEVNAAQWNDGAAAERWVAVPGTAAVGWRENKLVFPKDSVLVRTFCFGAGGNGSAGTAAPRRAVETQLLHFDGRRWNGYSYQWNDAQTDAELVPAGGAVVTFDENDPAAPQGKRQRVWQIASRAQCTTCHNSFADVTLAYNPMQLEREVAGDANAGHGGGAAQVERLKQMQLYPADAPRPAQALADPYDAGGDVERRARSYLHANCSHCHRFGGGGSALIDLRFDLPLRDTHTVSQRPNLGTFELTDPHVVTPGAPQRSVMVYRMAKTGRGRMPHIGSQVVDDRGLMLIEQWVRQMGEGAGPEPTASAIASTTGALDVALRLAHAGVKDDAGRRIVGEAMASPNEAVRDLFERFAPPGRTAGRLGPIVDAAKLLALKGDASRGRAVFYGASGAEAGGLCARCHRVGNDGETFGPDLSHIGTKYDRKAILENVLEPSKTIDPKFVTYVCRTNKGQDFSGILVEKTAQRVVLRDAQKHEAVVPTADVQRLVPQTISAMPESLLSGLTPQQAADLVEFLAAKK